MSKSSKVEAVPTYAIKDLKALRTNAVDQVSSLIVAAIVMVGLAVVLLGLVYLFETWQAPPAPLILEEEKIAGRGDHAPGFARDLEPPSAESIEELTEPTLEETLEAVTEAVSTIAATLDSMDTALLAESGAAMGDSRPPGPLGEGENIIPRFERWELKFTSRNLQSYANQLDSYAIELGAAGGGVKHLDYATGFRGSPKRAKYASGTDVKGLLFTSREENQLKDWDRQLLSRAGIPTERRLILKIVGKELEESLAQSEMRYAMEKLDQDQPIKARFLAKTIFESRPKSGGGFEFIVIEQRYRLMNEFKR